MAGARLELSMDTLRAEAALDFVASQLDGEGLELLLSDIGEYLVGSTQDRDAREVAPDGTPWPALSPRYAKRKEKKRPGAKMLVFDSHLLGDRLSWQVDGETLYVGTSAKYGAIQYFGGRGIPPRPWLGIDHQDEEEILALTRHHLLMGLEGSTP